VALSAPTWAPVRGADCGGVELADVGGGQDPKAGWRPGRCSWVALRPLMLVALSEERLVVESDPSWDRGEAADLSGW